MICDKYDIINFGHECYYTPLWGEYIFTDEYKKGERTLDLEVPKEIKCKKAIPLLFPTEKSFDILPDDTKSKAIHLFYSYMYKISDVYPIGVTLEVEKGKSVKFHFKEFLTVNHVDAPIAVYLAK